jgi:hypothetical protein
VRFPGEKKTFTTNMMIGCITAIVGFFLYSHFKLVATRDAAALKIVPEVQMEDKTPLLKLPSKKAEEIV